MFFIRPWVKRTYTFHLAPVKQISLGLVDLGLRLFEEVEHILEDFRELDEVHAGEVLEGGLHFFQFRGEQRKQFLAFQVREGHLHQAGCLINSST